MTQAEVIRLMEAQMNKKQIAKAIVRTSAKSPTSRAFQITMVGTEEKTANTVLIVDRFGTVSFFEDSNENQPYDREASERLCHLLSLPLAVLEKDEKVSVEALNHLYRTANQSSHLSASNFSRISPTTFRGFNR